MDNHSSFQTVDFFLLVALFVSCFQGLAKQGKEIQNGRKLEALGESGFVSS